MKILQLKEMQIKVIQKYQFLSTKAANFYKV